MHDPRIPRELGAAAHRLIRTGALPTTRTDSTWQIPQQALPDHLALAAD
ncbi:hypothetical protein ABTY61_40285 [Kitasatospora sp. NPDC096128]